MKGTYVATFAYSHSMRNTLQTINPMEFGYGIIKLNNDSKLLHEKAIKHICHYLKATSDK